MLHEKYNKTKNQINAFAKYLNVFNFILFKCTFKLFILRCNIKMKINEDFEPESNPNVVAPNPTTIALNLKLSSI